MNMVHIMISDDPISTYYLMDLDGERALFNRPPDWYNTVNSTTPNVGMTAADRDTAYVRAVIGFALSLSLYFCFMACICREERDASRKEVDRSIVRKRVLPHGQSQLIDSSYTGDEDVTAMEKRCSVCARCFERKKISPDLPETPSEILDSYICSATTTFTSHEGGRGKQSSGVDCASKDELVRAEEGSINKDEELLCSVCLEPFRVGELVAWSHMGHCHHVFHHKCILPWAVLGNEKCPVCREIFWRRTRRVRYCIHRSGEEEKESEMRDRTFCVRHGLVTPSTV